MVEAAGSCNKSVALPDQSMETHARSIKLDSNSFLEFPSNFESICLLIQLTPPFFFDNNQADNALSLTMELQARITLQSHLFTLRKEKKKLLRTLFLLWVWWFSPGHLQNLLSSYPKVVFAHFFTTQR